MWIDKLIVLKQASNSIKQIVRSSHHPHSETSSESRKVIWLFWEHPIFNGMVQDQAIQQQIKDLNRTLEWLSLLHSHDVLVLFKNSLSMLKLQYLWTDCSSSPLLSVFDDALRSLLSTILNVNLSDDQWFQASLPVRNGGLVIWCQSCYIACGPLHVPTILSCNGSTSCWRTDLRHFSTFNFLIHSGNKCHCQFTWGDLDLDLIWPAVKKAHIPASKEPIWISRADGKRPDEATLILWTRGKPLAWDVTVSDTYAASHLQLTSMTPYAAAKKAAVNKTLKYVALATMHSFILIAIETSGAWFPPSAEFIEDLER